MDDQAINVYKSASWKKTDEIFWAFQSDVTRKM